MTAAPDVRHEIDSLIESIGRRPQDLIALLQGIQTKFRYLPDDGLLYLAAQTGIPAADIEGVAGFYAQFRRKAVGKNILQVCHGTACHVKGAERIEDALRRHLNIEEGEETDPTGEFTIERVACIGCCSLAPVFRVGESTFGHLTSESAGRTLESYRTNPARTGKVIPLPQVREGRLELRVTTDSCCAASGSDLVRTALEDEVRRLGGGASIRNVSCTGACHLVPMVEVAAVGAPSGEVYTGVRPEDAARLVRKHLMPRSPLAWMRHLANRLLDTAVAEAPPAVEATDPRDPMICAFLGPQRHLAMEHSGSAIPLDLEGYIAKGGFSALDAVREANDPVGVVKVITESGLRGRGGAGFPTGRKWDAVQRATGSPKYLVCNGDEGDPGAFMDRMLLESFPFRVLEGMAIAAFAMDIHEGYLYIRAEYPQAVERITEAIRILEQRGILGDLKLKVVQGAGAFVCGEETALIASIEGKRGTPHLKPPYPAQSGLWEKPTCVNNVETYALVPWILRHGAEEFAAIGTEKSKGTKVFALAGAVRRGGLIEVPMGTTIRQVVEEIGGGALPGRRFKAVLIGGPSGGCVPASLADTRIDYDALQKVGAIMGSGGLVVLDDRSCMVDVARFFMRFTQNESCGKCSMCRVGTRRMREILDRLCEGDGRIEDLDELETLAEAVTTGSICGLGQTAPNPVLSTLRYFREEYLAHVEGRCPAGRCDKLIHYSVNDACIGCTRCAQVCPVDAIPMAPHTKHVIDAEKCVRCDACREVCTVEAIDVR